MPLPLGGIYFLCASAWRRSMAQDAKMRSSKACKILLNPYRSYENLMMRSLRMRCLGVFRMIKLKRVYEQEPPDDGVRYLVERLWPRGVKKESLHIEDWLKDAGPSAELRRWFSHDPEK